jgi:transcriptional regulator with XRE-family HTH domain
MCLRAKCVENRAAGLYLVPRRVQGVGPMVGPAHTLRWHRLNAGLTLDELAAHSKVGRNTVARLEHGGHAAAPVRRALADALGIEPVALAVGESTAETEPEPVPLAALRARYGLSVYALAQRAKVAPQKVYRAEEGRAIHPRDAKRLADFFGIRVTDFYPRDGDRGVTA